MPLPSHKLRLIISVSMQWMLVFEEPETKTLWLGKAVPRDWLVAGEAPLHVDGATTRYGRVSFSLTVAAAAGGGGYAVKANVSLPASFAAAAANVKPAGGLRLRIRTPLAHAGKLSAVTVGGKAWASFDAATETVDFSAARLTPELVRSGALASIVATFGAATAAPLRRASVDMSRRVLAEPLPAPPPLTTATPPAPPLLLHEEKQEGAQAALQCPTGLSQVDAFALNGTAWLACEDLQQPGGDIALVTCGRVERFGKGYSTYGTAANDSAYYLGLGNETMASARGDPLGAKLLSAGSNGGELTWAAVERAVPPIRKSGRTPGGWDYQTSDCDGVRTFVGSRGASVDFTFSDLAQDCSYNGSPSLSYALGMHTKAMGEGPQSVGKVSDWNPSPAAWNHDGVADGLVGDWLPSAAFYFPVFRRDASNCTQQMQTEFCNFTDGKPAPACASECGTRREPTCNASVHVGCVNATLCAQCKSCIKVLGEFCRTAPLLPTKQDECGSCVGSVTNVSAANPLDQHRYWTYVNIPQPDASGNREQATWMRFQQVQCSGPAMRPPCKLIDWPMVRLLSLSIDLFAPDLTAVLLI